MSTREGSAAGSDRSVGSQRLGAIGGLGGCRRGSVRGMPDPEPTRDPAREEAARAAEENLGAQESDDDVVARETAEAAAEAGRIGGRASSEPPPVEDVDEAHRPLAEAGEGEAEGFEQAEQELIEHASHGDQHAARRALEDAPLAESDDARASEAGEADFERSSERDDESS
jgi:hypothetical protein